MDMKAMRPGRQVELRLPCSRDMLMIVRMTATAVLARAGFSADKIDDIKMAVEEASAALIRCAKSGELFVLFACPEQYDDRLLITLSTSEPGSACSDSELSVLRAILDTIADRVEIAENGGSISRIILTGKMAD